MSKLKVDSNEIRVHRQGSGPTQVVYFQSGAGEFCQLPFFDRLAEGGLEVIVPELPGFGGSAPPTPRWRGVDDAVYHLKRTIDLLSPKGRLVLAGSSFGGWLAAEVATWFAERFDALVLISPVGLRIDGKPIFNIFGVPDIENHQAELDRRSNPNGVDLLRILSPSFAGTGQDAPLLHFLRSFTVVAQLGWNPYLHNPRLRDRLAAIRAKTLVLQGEVDGIIPKEHATFYAHEIAGAKLMMIPECGHMPVLEKPDLTARLILDFLSLKPNDVLETTVERNRDA